MAVHQARDSNAINDFDNPGFTSKDFDSLKSPTSGGFLQMLLVWRQREDLKHKSLQSQTEELIKALKKCDKNSSALDLTKRLQLFRGDG